MPSVIPHDPITRLRTMTIVFQDWLDNNALGCQVFSFCQCAELLASSALSDDSDDGQPFKRIHTQRAAEQQRQQQLQHGAQPEHIATPLKPLVTRRCVTVTAWSLAMCRLRLGAGSKHASTSERNRLRFQ